MKGLITQALVDKLTKAQSRAEVWDTKLLNFFVQVRASGRAAYYIRYSRPDTQEKVPYKLGDAEVLSANDARTLANTWLNKVAMGQDPAQERRERRECPTLSEAVRDLYLPFVKASKKSWQTDETMWRCHILPALGHKRLSAISTADIDALTGAMRRGESAGSTVAYAPATCNRVVVLLRYFFNLAMDTWGIAAVKSNPARRAIQLEVNNERQVFLSPEQVGALVQAGRPKPGQQNPYTLPIVMLIVLTGVRRANALKARWCEFDEVRGLWNIPVTKSGKPQSIQLSQEVLNLLASLPSRGRSDYLFPSPKTGQPFTSIYYSWNTLRQTAGLPDVRLHDLRHTFASLLINGGASLFVVQKALGHSNPKITMRYAHLTDATQRQAFQGAASLIAHVLPITTQTQRQAA